MKFPHRFLEILPLLSIIFFIMGGCTLTLGGYPLFPALFLISIYYWVVFHPPYLSLGSLFGVGLLYDALIGNELGLSSLLLMLSILLGQYSRPFLSPHRFFFMWGIFCLYSFGYIFLYGIFSSGGIPLFISWIYGIILYPLAIRILNYIYVRARIYVLS